MKVAFAIGDRIELMHIKSAIGRKVSDKKYGSQLLDFDGDRTRSEERRVGKECRSRWSPYH